ncbi:MAG: ATP synthase F1 subunit delta [Bdellovibrionaceae bacterium]|nr:ATP synthase F1 subunit delta [Pseudobdellovibrionaceae bacterium]MDW8189360.1 ATP synthase F1 subunit delta [Pseudobdellovibrionaceae bacterium]
MKKTDGVILSRRYARALFQKSREEGILEQTLDELQTLNLAFSSDDLYNKIPISKPLQKEISDLLSNNGLKCTKLVAQFLKLLLANNRIQLLPLIVKEFQSLCDGHHDLVRGTLITAAEIDADQIAKIQEIVTRKIGKRVIFEHRYDPNILGGVIARVGGWTFDDSLRRHLNVLTQKLLN